MKIKIFGEPKFQFILTRSLYETINKCSQAHYDGVCKSLSEIGGFVYGWGNMFSLSLDNAETEIDVQVRWRELDTLLKVLEVLWFWTEPMEPEALAEALTFTGVARRAMISAGDIAQHWVHELE